MIESDDERSLTIIYHSAYMRGMVKVKGSIGLALKLTGLQKLLSPQPSL